MGMMGRIVPNLKCPACNAENVHAGTKGMSYGDVEAALECTECEWEWSQFDSAEREDL